MQSMVEGAFRTRESVGEGTVPGLNSSLGNVA